MAKKKTTPIPNELPVVAIVWKDAFVARHRQLELDLVLQTTVGYVLGENEEALLLVSSVCLDPDSEESSDYTVVPKANIIKRANLGIFQPDSEAS